MVHVEITNFQSISKMEMDFEGFSTIVGRNFIGKSATLRAINAALTNKAGSDFIRWGQKFCEVRIVVNGFDILWHKESSNNYYVINGKRYDKIGRDEPPKPVKDAGFSVIKIGNEKVNLNYAEQFFPLFLVDKQDSKGADLIAAVYGLDVLYKAVDLCGKERKANKAKLKIRDSDRESAAKALDPFDGFEDILKTMPTIDDRIEGINNAEGSLDKLRRIERDLKSVLTIYKKISPVSELDIPVTPITHDTVALLESLKKDFKRLKEIKKDLATLKDIDDIESVDESMLSEIIDRYSSLDNLKKLSSGVQEYILSKKHYDTISKINVPDSETIKGLIDEVVELKDLDTGLLATKNELKKYKSIDDIGAIDSSLDPGIIKDISDLKSVRADIKNLKDNIDKVNADLEVIETELVGAEGELSSFDSCPLCGGDI